MLPLAWAAATGVASMAAAVASVVTAIRRARTRGKPSRAEMMRLAAALAGLEVRSPGLPSLREALDGGAPAVRPGTESECEAEGELDGYPAIVFDAQVPVGSARQRSVLVVFRPSRRLPRFQLTAKPLMESDLPGFPTKDTVGLESHPALADKYRLVSKEPDAALALIKPAVALFFETAPEQWDVLSNGAWLVVAPFGGVPAFETPQRLADLIRQAGKVAGLFLASADTR